MSRFLRGLLGVTIFFALGIIAFLFNLQQRSPFSTEEFIGILSEKSTAENPEEYINALRTCMLAREPEVSVTYVGSGSELEKFAEDVLQDVFAVDDVENPSDFDYLQYIYGGMRVKMEGVYGFYKVTYQFDYLESKEQTEAVDAEIEKLYKKWKMDKLSPYKKVKKIHDYIIKNASYDMSGAANTAYSNLIGKESACQGYAALFYKMCTVADVPCRVIVGQGNNESHAWNIVKLKGLWYNLDCTWDDPVGPLGDDYVSYDYFLKGQKNFGNHIPDARYQTEEFRDNYHISEADY